MAVLVGLCAAVEVVAGIPAWAGRTGVPLVPDRINKAALGKSGGPFCDAVRDNILVNRGPESAAFSRGELSMEETKGLLDRRLQTARRARVLAPPELEKAMGAAFRYALLTNAAIVKASYDAKKVDASVYTKLDHDIVRMDTGPDKERYFRKTCGIQLERL